MKNNGRAAQTIEGNTVVHNIGPVFDSESKILILGSFPSVKSREAEFFYAHPRNRFWSVLSAVFTCKKPETVEEKKAFLLSNHIALWDVVGQCEISASADTSIKNVIPNDVSVILKKADIRSIIVNGKTAEKYYNKYLLGETGIKAVCLPSTSPANAAKKLDDLICEWSIVGKLLNNDCSLGLKRGTVALYPHETEWEAEAKRTIKKLKSILNGVAADIQHVGSTAVKSICAKPIIDIAVGVKSFDEILEKKQALEENGFYFRNSSIENQLLFACGSFYDGTGEYQTHFIHVVIYGSKEWQDYLLVRDYLNSDIEAAKAYESLKMKLAEECPVDNGREKYLAGKHDFIEALKRKALTEKYLGQTVRIKIDRPKGYIHKKEKYTLVYPLNYGYIPGVYGGDGEELDVYLLGVDEAVEEYDCKIIGAVIRRNDVEDKLIAAPEGMNFTADEAYKMIEFQEKWYDTEIKTVNGK